MWRTRSIFISSTFEDFQAERDFLRERVFPELEEWLRARRERLEWVDLRVGVPVADEESLVERNRQVLKVCLAEVQRCKPFMLVLIGDRYGTTLAPDLLRAAADEVGMTIAPSSLFSVTELELHAGAFGQTGSRALFYFREGLPYGRMPKATAARYSDSYSTAQDASARRKTLFDLQSRIERSFPGRVRRYQPVWDERKGTVSGLDEWGRRVADDLWTELNAEPALALSDAASPFQVERRQLDEFVEEHARDVVGRDDLLLELSLFARLERPVPALGYCITGEAGSGKSAAFAALKARLGDADILVLAHAAAASPRAALIDEMLRRWIDELCLSLGRANELASDASEAEIEAAFASLLSEAAANRKVLILIDALDQLESTPRTQSISWAPRVWPGNVRIIVTGIAGGTTDAWARTSGIAMTELAPLGVQDAQQIVAAVSSRYHRRMEPAVIAALLDRPDFSGNPLWIVLAAEELNLVDGDDLRRAQRDYLGPPADQLRAMMVDTARALPSDVDGLYRRAFSKAGEIFGAAFAEAFVGVTAISRNGWREGDLRALLPALSAQEWNELRFAQLRRLFRGQMRRRSVLEQWDFAHAQMRRAALKLLDPDTRRTLHRAVVSHLVGLPADDPVRASEIMFHMLAAEDWDRAAHYLADLSLPAATMETAARAVAAAILATADEEWANPLQILRLGLVSDPQDRFQTLQCLQYEVLDWLVDRGQLSLERRLKLHTWILQAFQSGEEVWKQNLHWRSCVSVACTRLADDHVDLGDLNAAAPLHETAVKIFLDLTRDDPEFGRWNRNLSVAYNRLGLLFNAKGDKEAARRSYRNSLEQIELALRKSPDPSWRRDLVVTKRYLAKAEGADPGEDVLAITKTLLHAAPDDLVLQTDLARQFEDKGHRALQGHRFEEALSNYRSSSAIWERALLMDAGDLEKKHRLAMLSRNLARALFMLDAQDEGLETLRKAAKLSDELTTLDPLNSNWARDSAETNLFLAEHTTDLDEAEAPLAKVVRILTTWLPDNPNSSEWLDLNIRSKSCSARIREARGLPDEADAALEAALAADRASKIDPRSRHAATVIALKTRAEILFGRKDWGGAEAAYRAVIENLEGKRGGDESPINDERVLSACRIKLGAILGSRGEYRNAIAVFGEERDRLRRLPTNDAVAADLALCTRHIGYSHACLGDMSEAVSCYREAIELLNSTKLRAAAEMAPVWRCELSLAELRAEPGGDLRSQQQRCEAGLRAAREMYDENLQNTAARGALDSWYKALRDIQVRRGDLFGAQATYIAMEQLDAS